MYVAYVCTLLHVVTCYFVLLGVVASVYTPLLTRTQQLPTLLGQQCGELLHPFAHHCQHGRNNSQHRCPALLSCDVTQRLCSRMFVEERFE